jgi:hypothetical protein
MMMMMMIKIPKPMTGIMKATSAVMKMAITTVTATEIMARRRMWAYYYRTPLLLEKNLQIANLPVHSELVVLSGLAVPELHVLH